MTTKKLSFERISLRKFIYVFLPSLILALLIAFGSYHFINRIIKEIYTLKISISADLKDSEKSNLSPLNLRGIICDGEWLNISDISFKGTWVEKSDEMILSDEYGEPLFIELPISSEVQLVFDVGPDQGGVKVVTENTTLYFNLFNERKIPEGLSFYVPVISDTTIRIIRNIWIVVICVFIITLIVLCYLASHISEKQNKVKNEEVWGNLLRGFCAFIIVWLHCSCNRFNEFGTNKAGWYSSLVINSFTAFAVPCFYMLSGAYLLRKKHTIRETFTKRVSKIIVPLLFWSIIYILVNGKNIPESLIRMFFQPQESHLWFIYCLLGIYMLLPILSRLYFSLDNMNKCYLLVLLLIFPAFFHDIQYLINQYTVMPYFAVFWPDLGLFFLGAVIWENREWLCNKDKIYVFTFILGFTITIAMTWYTSMRDNIPNKNFISCIGSVGVILMAFSLFCLILSLEKYLIKIPIQIRRLIHVIGNVSMGVYFIHVLAIMYFGDLFIKYGFGDMAQNGQRYMLALAILCYIVSAIICFCGKQIPYIKRLF